MTDKKKNGWIKFVPSLDLPKERVSIAYDTHDERGVRYAYGYFQFFNGTCGCFFKDGNEQPKSVKLEDIKYWMLTPAIDSMQEESVSKDLEKAAQEYAYQRYDEDCRVYGYVELAFKAGANWQKKKSDHAIEVAHMAGEEEGKNLMKQQMLQNAITATCFGFQGAALFSFRLPSDNYLVGSERKIVLIKDE